MFRNVLINSDIKISYSLLIDIKLLITAIFECFYIYIPNSKEK